MIEYFVSANNKYTSDNDLFFKNESTLLDENGKNIDAYTFKQLIKKETANFIHQNYSNIIVLVGAGASVVVKDDGIDANFGKTVSMLADLINAELKRIQNVFRFRSWQIFVNIMFQWKMWRKIS